MESRAAEHERIRDYLLGTAEPDAQEELELRLLVDADFHEELLAAENEVVYDYLTGALSKLEKEQFDKHFLSTPERRQKLRFFSTLIQSIDRLPKPLSEANPPPSWRRFFPSFLRFGNPFLRLSFAVGVLLLVFGGAWVLVKNLRHGANGAAQPAVYVVTLSPGRQRDAGAETVRVTRTEGAALFKFHLTPPAGDYGGHRAIFTSDQGEQRFQTDDVKVEAVAGARVLSLSVPTSELVPGDYELALYGLVSAGNFEEIEVYYFRLAP